MRKRLDVRRTHVDTLECVRENSASVRRERGGDAWCRGHTLSLAASLGTTVLSVAEESAHGPDIGSTGTGEASEQASELGVIDSIDHVEHGTPVDTILECIESTGRDAVGMGTTRGTDGILLGGVAEATVQCGPVLTVGDPS